MEKSIRDHICDTLDDLSGSHFKRFIDKLCDSRLETRIRKNNVEGKDTSDIAQLLVEKYTEKHAVDTAVQVLRSIGCNQQAEELLKDSNCPPPLPVSPTPAVVSPLPVSPPPAVVSPSTDVTKLTESTFQFKQTILQEKPNDIYSVKEKPLRKRLALLINNVEFDNKNMKRNGALRDEENILQLLTALGYEVIKYNNLSGKDMEEKIKEFAKRDEHAESDSTFVVIMSHGKRDAILGIHYGYNNNISDVLLVDKIYVHLNTSNCPNLHNKPKVILLQACRGGEDGSVWVSDSEEAEMSGMESDDVLAHKEKDFISLLSCTPDTKSYRHNETGTLFIRYLVEVFNTNAHKDHIEELFRQIMMRFEDLKFLKQMVCKDRTSLVKLFYLFPGL